MSKAAMTFPGQGSQSIGMGAALADAYPAARAVFEEVDDALGEDLFALMREGPEDELRLTENAQPALMAVSMAVVRVLEGMGLGVPAMASCVAGHSLGEYTALCAAGSIRLAEAARLLKTRGQAMQRAVPVGEGAMAALLGFDLQAAAEVAAAAGQGEVCEIANDNAPGQIVIAGTHAAVERAIELAKAMGARRALMLPVSAPFHCSLMGPAADVMEAALATVNIAEPAVPLIANVSAEPITQPAEIRRRLVEQVTSRVRWRECVLWMTGAGGISELVEIGAGKVLTGLARRIAGEVEAVSIGTPDDIANFMAAQKPAA